MRTNTFVLRMADPAIAERGGGISAARNIQGSEVMDTVLERLGLPEELRGEQPKAKANAPKKAETEAVAGEAAEEATGAATEESAETTEATEPAQETEATGEATEETTEATEPEFTEEQQTWVNQQNEAQAAELEKVKGEAATATAKVTELEGRLQTMGRTPVAVAAIDPLFLVDDPAQLAKHESEIADFERWALAHWDGVEATEASADGKVPATRGYSAAEVRQRYGQMKEVRDKVVPAARKAIEERKAWAAEAKKDYPELFDAKRPEAQLAENLLRQAPGLKAVFPNIYLVIGDALRGEKARLAAKKAAKAPVKPAVNGATNGKPKPPRPGAGASTVVKPKKNGNEITAKRFMDMGGSREALVEMLSGADLPTA